MKIEGPKVFLVDFDGTTAYHEYPFIGEEVPGCVDVMKKLIKAGHDLILLTMRYGIQLDEAKEWFKVRDIELFAVNCNPMFETGSRKVYGNKNIDDHNAGCPLIHDYSIHKKPFVDWVALDKIFEQEGYYVKQDVAKKSVSI